MTPEALFRVEYVKVKSAVSADCKSDLAGKAILELITVSLAFLKRNCRPIKLISKVPGKEYFTFTDGKIVARPANEQLFIL